MESIKILAVGCFLGVFSGCFSETETCDAAIHPSLILFADTAARVATIKNQADSVVAFDTIPKASNKSYQLKNGTYIVYWGETNRKLVQVQEMPCTSSDIVKLQLQ